MFYGITMATFRRIVYLYAKANKIPAWFGIRSGRAAAGYDFTTCFLERHKLSLRMPQQTNIARIMGFNRVQINRFFDNLIKILQKFGFKADQIYNIDETGVSTVPEQKVKAISLKGTIFSTL